MTVPDEAFAAVADTLLVFVSSATLCALVAFLNANVVHFAGYVRVRACVRGYL